MKRPGFQDGLTGRSLISGDFVLSNNLLMDAYLADSTSIRDISPLLLDNHGRLRVVPASILAETTAQERLLFGYAMVCAAFPLRSCVISCEAASRASG